MTGSCKQAQGLAQFVAEEAVNLSRAANRESEQEMLDSAQRQLGEARTAVEHEQSAWLEFTTREPLAGSKAELDSLTYLRETLRQNLADTRTELAAPNSQAGRQDGAGTFADGCRES